MWDEFICLSESFSILFEGHFGKSQTVPFQEHSDHTNLVYTSDKLALGHISIIDKRKEKGLWMMHVAAYANPEYPMPVFGYDVVTSKTKVTGVFFDVSPTIIPSKTENYFAEITRPFKTERTRELPPWAKEIFSPHMIAAGMPKPNEIKQLSYLGRITLTHWIEELQNKQAQIDAEITAHQNKTLQKYCQNQLQNTNSKNVMLSLGLDEDYVDTFKKYQFPF